jgi:CDP-glucose 4,6-dehydratase
MHYLVTGHTGFKGSWLIVLLRSLGHQVSGLSLRPEIESLFNQAELGDLLEHDLRGDVRDKSSLASSVQLIDPDIIIHLAAQPLVRYSYAHPIETFETNVLGTLNLLEASKDLASLRSTLIITTDKVYRNLGHTVGYSEDDALGGVDPYSASKAAADIATQSWVKSFGSTPVAIARAGNVVGGGDWAADRLIPDLVRSYQLSRVPVIRNPDSIRPWQHVLDCLHGYLQLIDLMTSRGVQGEWNFGPNHQERHTVAEVVNTFSEFYGVTGTPWTLDDGTHPKESEFLLLDSTKARTQLGWTDQLDFQRTLEWTSKWYRDFLKLGARKATMSQIELFLRLK